MYITLALIPCRMRVFCILRKNGFTEVRINDKLSKVTQFSRYQFISVASKIAEFAFCSIKT